MKAFHESGGRYVLVKETTPNVFDSIAENLTKADAERIVAIEQAATDALESLKRLSTECLASRNLKKLSANELATHQSH